MLKLFHQKYWTRLWIIQEIILARRILVRLGKYQIEWDDLIKFCTSPPTLGSGDTDTISCYSVLKKFNMTTPRKILQQRNDIIQTRFGTNTNKCYQRPLFELLQTYQQSCCSDVRDKVFELYSLSLPCCRQHSPVDYAQASGEVLKSVLLHHLISHQDDIAEQIESIGFYNNIKSSFIHFRFDDIRSEKQTSQDNMIQPVSQDRTTTSVLFLFCGLCTR